MKSFTGIWLLLGEFTFSTCLANENTSESKRQHAVFVPAADVSFLSTSHLEIDVSLLPFGSFVVQKCDMEKQMLNFLSFAACGTIVNPETKDDSGVNASSLSL